MVYVDDILVTSNDLFYVTQLLVHLTVEFSIQDLDHMSYFLGIEVQYTSHWLSFSQSRYALDIAHKASMTQCQLVSTPIVVGSCLSTTSNNGFACSDPTLYCQVIRALQYLTFTWPHISFATKKVCQFMLNLRTISLQLNICYVHGTSHFNLSFTTSYDQLHGFSNFV